MLKQHWIFILLALLIAGCRHEPVERSFYYWKTTFSLTGKERQWLSDMQVEKLYIRLFDVNWDATAGKAVPIGKIRFIREAPRHIKKIVPVIYIVNKALQHTPNTNVEELAVKMVKQAHIMMETAGISFHELQIDCDWTDATREKYFRLLTRINNELAKKKQIVSATIRLHQVKYFRTTGIPPVHHGMLMYYNMGKPDAFSERNSIYNKEDAAKYVKYVKKYPMPLDIALPMFGWGVHIRDNQVIGLLNISPDDFKNNVNFIGINNQGFKAISSFFFRGHYFMKNDRVKIETADADVCCEAAKEISSEINHTPASVAIFHLDSLMLLTHEKKIEKIFNTFR